MEFTSRTREYFEEQEQKNLADYAYKSVGTNTTRLYEEEEHPYRTNFQRDRDRIIHSRAFRRLKHKRQVFLVTTGDHYRTRLTHTIEVVQLSRSISRALGLNEDLSEAIALGHDLGHTPFGHIGEIVLHKILHGKDNLEGDLSVNDRGGFKHNYQSVRVVDCLEKKYHFDGVNLTLVVREGILKHTRLHRHVINYPDWSNVDLNMDLPNATTLEGQVVAICDEIAQRTHDLEDGLRAGFVTIPDVQKLAIIEMVERSSTYLPKKEDTDFEYIGRLIKKLINLLVTDVIDTTLKNIKTYYQQKRCFFPFEKNVVTFSSELHPLQRDLDRFIYKRIIHRPGIEWTDDMAVYILRGLFRAYLNRPRELQRFPMHRYFSRYIKWQYPTIDQDTTKFENKSFIRLIADYIAGMTDHFAMKEYERLVGA